MKEKRVHIRSTIELAASFGIGDDARPERDAKISNISSGGFCFTTAVPLKVGQLVDLSVDLDTDQDVLITVKVVWIKKNGSKKNNLVGVQIVETEGPDFERFMEFYKSQL